jgi:hypothetical protein
MNCKCLEERRKIFLDENAAVIKKKKTRKKEEVQYHTMTAPVTIVPLIM